MRCPIINDVRNPKSLADIEYNDLSQLEHIDEGYAVEYKSEWNKDVQKKLPKVMSSFANAAGGWLFIGIDDKGGITPIQKPRTDFAQQIGERLSTSVSPYIRFESRFIKDPDNNNQGVLVVEIEEGFEPPYLTDGQIFVRVGSSSMKEEPANAATLIDLNTKARRNYDSIKEFCKRSVYYPPTQIVNSRPQYNYPIFDIYLKRLYPDRQPFYAEEDIADIKEKAKTLFIDYYSHPAIAQHSARSIIFRPRRISSVDSAEPTMEVFYGGSIKASIPLYLLHSEELNSAIDRLASLFTVRNKAITRVLNGTQSVKRVIAIANIIQSYLEAQNYPLYDYAVSYEFENTQGVMLTFEGKVFDEYVAKYGIPFFSGVDAKTNINHFSKYRENEGYTLASNIEQVFLDACGLALYGGDDEETKLVSHLIFGHDSPETTNS